MHAVCIHQVPFYYHCYVKKIFPPVVKSQEVHLVTGDHVGGLRPALGNKKKPYTLGIYFSGYATVDLLTPACHILDSGLAGPQFTRGPLLCAGAMKRPIAVNPKPAAPDLLSE